MFENATNNGISPLVGFKRGTSVNVNYAEGAKLWSNDQSGFGSAVSAVQASDVAVVLVGCFTGQGGIADHCAGGNLEP